GRPRYESLSLIAAKDEHTILAVDHLGNVKRTASREAELLTFQTLSRQTIAITDECIRVKRVVPQEAVGRALERIGSRFGRHAADSRPVTAIVRCVMAGQDAELSHEFGIRIENGQVTQQVVIIAAIQQESD